MQSKDDKGRNKAKRKTINLRTKINREINEIKTWVNKTETSREDGGIGRYTLPPRTTKRRTTTNLKTKNNQN